MCLRLNRSGSIQATGRMVQAAAMRSWRQLQTVSCALYRTCSVNSPVAGALTTATKTRRLYSGSSAKCCSMVLVPSTHWPSQRGSNHLSHRCGRCVCSVCTPALCLSFRHAGTGREGSMAWDGRAVEESVASRLAEMLMSEDSTDPLLSGVCGSGATGATGEVRSTLSSTEEQAGNDNTNDYTVSNDKDTDNTVSGDNSSDPDEGSEGDGNNNDGKFDHKEPDSLSGHMVVRVLRLHNLPRGWMHEDIAQFIDSVAAHAGVRVTPSRTRADGQNRGSDQVEESDASAIPRTRSDFLHRVIVPFGRRTGLVYGTPLLYVNTHALADYLLHHLRFDADDYRHRIYFTEDTDSQNRRKEDDCAREGDHGRIDLDESVAPRAGSSSGSPFYLEVEDSLADEQQELLRSLELDRYLLAPDLMLDIAKLHQQRLVTRGGKVVLDAFLDGDEDRMPAEKNELEEGAKNDLGKGKVGSARRRTGQRGVDGAALDRRVVAQKSLGRGSLHNMPIPKPYVQGRRI